MVGTKVTYTQQLLDKVEAFQADNKEKLNQLTLGQITDLMAVMDELKKFQAEKENEVKLLKSTIQKYSEELLPEVLMANNMTEFQLPSGNTMKLKISYFGSTSKERMKDIKQFLEDNDGVYLVKEAIEASNSLNEDGQSVSDILSDIGIPHGVKESINTGSLKAYIKRLFTDETVSEEVKADATELFKVHIKNEIEIK